LAQVPNKFRDVEDILGIKQQHVFNRFIKAEIKEEILDEDMKVYPFLQEKILYGD
jgi:hypothetical protein